ncbi:unnamed protein product [Closterium sp. NIES-64]|nr:unnamed protein product [Closterium sp. NIES-64]
MTLWKAHMDSDSATFSGVMREVGAGRQQKQDQLASLLVQVLGVKEAGELKEDFGFFMQNFLSRGVRERGEGEKKAGGAVGPGAGAGRGVGEEAGGEGWQLFEEMMGMMLTMGESDAPTMADVMTRMRHVMGVDGEEERGGTVLCMVAESEAGGRGGEGDVVRVLRGRPRRMHGGGEGRGFRQARVEDAAIEKSKKWLNRDIVTRARMKWEMATGQVVFLSDIIVSDPNGHEITAAADFSASLTNSPTPSLVPVNSTNPIVSAMTYRVGCILQWVRIYSSDFISAGRCFKGSPHGRILPMRHPLWDLPSLLVRLGAIPKPLPWSQFDSEWEEWPQGEEDAVKFPDDQSVRCFRLGSVEEAAEGDQGNRGRGTRGGGESGGGSSWRRGKGRGRRSGGKGGGGAHPSRAAAPSKNRAMPIVRCAADAHFLVEFAGHQVYPPACARCRSCLDQFTYHIPFLTLLANFAYRPTTVLLNRFLSVFPPRSPEFSKLVDLLLLEPFLRSTRAAFQVHVVRERAEEIPVHFLLNVALNWPNAMLQVEEIGMVGLRRVERGPAGGGRNGGRHGEGCVGMVGEGG